MIYHRRWSNKVINGKKQITAMDNEKIAGLVLSVMGMLTMAIARLDLGNVTPIGVGGVALFLLGIILFFRHL